jgi:hypothetical protein
MSVASVILTLSAALFFFYFQALCERVLRREFDQPYFLSVVSAGRLEFPSIRKALEEFDGPAEYSQLHTMLKCDFLTLVYLLKDAAKVGQGCSARERMLMLYFRLIFFTLIVRHLLRLREKPAILKLTAILQYFANMVSLRVSTVRFGNLSPWTTSVS